MTTSQPQRWAWCERPVNTYEDHFELCFGSQNSDRTKHIPVVRVGRPWNGVFGVQFLIDRHEPALLTLAETAIGELNYYLVELGEPNPWAYAGYHCGTMANVHASIHWSFHAGQETTSETARCPYGDTEAPAEGDALGLPAHGPIDCIDCYPSSIPRGGDYAKNGWKIERNPGSWGSHDPVVLVLGFSKGPHQCHDILSAEERDFDAIPFRGMRPKLTKILQRLGLLGCDDDIGRHINAAESDFAFGSLVRCSLSRLDEANGEYTKSGSLIRTLSKNPDVDFVRRCICNFLGTLPSRLRLVVLLGNDDAYIETCITALRQVHPGLHRLNPVTYHTGGVVWVHVVHPSGAGVKHVQDWLRGKAGKQSEKRSQAIEGTTASRAIEYLRIRSVS